MKNIMGKMNSKGETLIETLIAILILSLSALMLANMALSAAHINKRAAETDDEYRLRHETAVKQESPIREDTVTVTVGLEAYNYTVDIYGEPDNNEGFTSYKLKEATAP